MKKIVVSLLAILTLVVFAQSADTKPSDTGSSESIRYVGSRASAYGFSKFPQPLEIASVYDKMADKIPGSTPASVWIVGVINDSTCRLSFPNPTGSFYPNIVFGRTDKNEEYLKAFDSSGAKVFLQVEAGMADMPTLIKLVLDQYSHHPSVVGFGVDIEWFPSRGETNGDPQGICHKLLNTELANWDNAVKSVNPSYRMFVKHWIPSYCGTSAVSDVIYINDTQGFKSAGELIGEFKGWAKRFAPNDVGFQIGYPNDTTWWCKMKDPLKDLTAMIDSAIPTQTNHIFWVDFTLHRPELVEYWQSNPVNTEVTTTKNDSTSSTIPSNCLH